MEMRAAPVLEELCANAKGETSGKQLWDYFNALQFFYCVDLHNAIFRHVLNIVGTHFPVSHVLVSFCQLDTG